MDPEQIPTPAPDSSPGGEPAPDVTATPPASSAEPSPASPDVERKTLLEVVRGAVEPDSIEEDTESRATAASSAADGESDGRPAQPTDSDVSDDALLAALEQLKGDVPLGKIERFREVLAENRQLKGTADQYQALDQTLNDIGANARRMGMTPEDLVALFAWPNLLAQDPAKAVEQLRTFTSSWEERIGRTLPADLAQKVEDGLLDEATAKEVATLRAQTVLTRARSEAEIADMQRAGVERTQNEIRDSVNAYQAELRRTDPDYTKEKHEMTIDALHVLVAQRGLPATVEEARAIAKEAHETVTRRLQAFKPAPRSIHAPTVGRRLNKPAESQPKTMGEAIARSIGM